MNTWNILYKGYQPKECTGKYDLIRSFRHDQSFKMMIIFVLFVVCWNQSVQITVQKLTSTLFRTDRNTLVYTLRLDHHGRKDQRANGWKMSLMESRVRDYNSHSKMKTHLKEEDYSVWVTNTCICNPYKEIFFFQFAYLCK